MDGLAAPARASRPTILVGYGAFGLGVLRRLLGSAAPRGILAWEEPRAGAAASERSLQDLALVWVPDPMRIAGQQVDDEDASEGSSFEMMRDLYRQIHQVEERDDPESDFAAAVSSIAEKLLSATTRAGRRNALPLGLDVIVLARPTTPQVVGSLDRMLLRGVEALANNANLQRGVQSAEALTFIGIFDFENYWDRGEAGRPVRQAVHNSIERWGNRRRGGKPSFGRFYLVDGRTDDGIRDELHRVDEITLFLELLLFEGQRSGDLQRLYRAQAVAESPLATFGVRLMERSAGLLSRLAASRFGIGWLAYAAGTESAGSDGQRQALRQRLAAYGPPTLERFLQREPLARLIDEQLAALERELMALPLGLADWPQRARARYEAVASELEEQLAAAARARMAQINGDLLTRMPEDLRAAVDAALRDDREPVPLGAVVAEIDDAVAELGRAPALAAPTPGVVEALWGRVAALAGDYRRYQRDRVDVDGLRRWWWPLAAALAAGLTPLVTELLGDVPRPDPTHFLTGKAYDLLQKVDDPVVVSLSLLVFLGWLGSTLLQRRIAGRTERARRFYLDPERGRFVDRLREGLEPGGPLRAQLDYALDRLLLDMSASVRGEISRELGRLAARLRERRREMVWLREQLREFLRLHGLDEQRPGIDRALRDGSGIRHAVERSGEFERMLARNPPVVGRFRSTPETAVAFDSWQQRYNGTFLQPIAFLDRLSVLYQDPLQQELARAGAGPEHERREAEFSDFLAYHRAWSLAFPWKRQEGLPPGRAFCLLPRTWRTLPAVLPALGDIGIPREMVLDGGDAGRAYLLRLQAGVALECLLE
ncbi:MAG TPA: hypothetical protein VFS60_13345 [Thermoanaerobaculia bacterium]|nr:hypothetical protein [Thermoanaerobaculia bacterium]